MKQLTNLYIIILFVFSSANLLIAQSNITPDYTSETKMNQSSTRKVSGNENLNSVKYEASKIPQALLDEYNAARDNYNDAEVSRLSAQMETFLAKPQKPMLNASDFFFEDRTPEAPFTPDWYDSDVLVSNQDVGYNGSYRNIELKQGEDGWLYMAVNRRNIENYNGGIRVYRSSNGGANWSYVNGVVSSNYWSSFSMLVERRHASNDDSVRILIYITSSPNANYNDAFLSMVSFRRDGSAYYSTVVAQPDAGARFESVSACSDGVFFSTSTAMHIAVRQETNNNVGLLIHHFRSTDWGLNYTEGRYLLFYDDNYPSIAFSNEEGNDSVYIATERRIAVDEWEIRLLSNAEIPSNNFQVRYITDALPGNNYERPDITIQQRHFALPQQMLVTCTKNDRAVYHASTDGGASWNVDASLGLISQPVDYTACNSDTLTAGGGYFVAAYVDLNGDSVTVRRGILGAMGSIIHRRNSLMSTGFLAPACAIYKNGTSKYSAIGYAGQGPTNVYFNSENLITGIEPIGSTTPEKFTLGQNYPNPFNPVTNINFSIPKAGNVKLIVFDALGRQVAELVNGVYSAGNYKVDYDASTLSTGVYFYKIEAEGFTDIKKMMLIK
jgi:hypothetical protein